jgi:hypothetical protein
MPKAIKISDTLADAAALFAKIEHRSVAGQIEYWAKLGKIADANPDLPVSFIKDILLGREELRSGQRGPYVFGEGK